MFPALPPNTLYLLEISGLALLPSALWLLYYLRQDVHAEPRSVILKLFLAGLLLPPFVASAESAVQGWVVAFGFSPLALIFLLGAASLEEIAKYLAALVIFYHNKEFDEPVDAMIYLVVVALGFAAGENIVVVLNTALHHPDESIALLLSLRFVGANLLHTLTSGIVGYFIARSYFFKEPLGSLRGLVIATVLHTFFNFFILQSSPGPNVFLPQYILLTIALLIGGIVVVWSDFHKLKRYGVSNLTLS